MLALARGAEGPSAGSAARDLPHEVDGKPLELSTGRYAHRHGIVALGGAPGFRADSTVAVWLDRAGDARVSRVVTRRDRFRHPTGADPSRERNPK